jgi:hypothetical protein
LGYTHSATDSLSIVKARRGVSSFSPPLSGIHPMQHSDPEGLSFQLLSRWSFLQRYLLEAAVLVASVVALHR